MATTVPATDELMHEATDDPQFNESMYFNFVDGKRGFSTLIRMGNRVNEGHAEVTVLLYLPDGGAAIFFDRSPIETNDRFDSGGLRFDVVEPLEHVRVTFAGDAHVLADGRDLADPKRAFAESPVRPVRLTLDYGSIALYGLGEGDDAIGGIAGAEDSIATGHYQGPCRVTGTVTIGDEDHAVEGLGFRDHSWGPRKWQGPRWWRWISCLCDEQNGFVAWLTKIGDTVAPPRGMVMRDGNLSLVRSAEVTSTYDPDLPHYPATMDVTLGTDEGEWKAHGERLTLVPLRHRREGVTARLSELVCRYDFEGLEGYGISEYHDLMLDGIPAGMGEA
ncbi:MAG: hypothetical protein M5U14_12770 [Acidimicrobiia bacterium]|nr:hypothetical protein [Acidimicrobiia bacterium]